MAKTIPPNIAIPIPNYPVSKQEEVVDHYFGQAVADPYRWLEDDLSAETKDWVQAQNKVSRAYLAQIPFRESIAQRLAQLMDYSKISAPFQEGSYWYVFKNTGLQNQWVLYRRAEDAAEEELFLDPNTFSSDGTASLASIHFSPDGSLLAYQISEGGSDWRKVVVMRTSDKSIIGDTLTDIKFSNIAWQGNEGFYYSSYAKPTQGSALSGVTDQHQVYYHRLHSAQQDDQLIIGGPDFPRRYISVSITEDNSFLIISAANTTSGNELAIKRLSDPAAPWINLITDQEHNHEVVDTIGDQLILYTELDAPNGRVVKVDLAHPATAEWETLIPECGEALSLTSGAGKFFATYLKDAQTKVLQYSLEGQLDWEISLPGLGTASGFEAKEGADKFYYTFTSYTHPPTVYAYDPKTGQSSRYQRSSIAFDSEAYESKQVFYTSTDGVQVPMMLTYKKGLDRTLPHPTLLYGYGGFNISLTPSFSASTVILLEQGGIYAVANLRGGGEYGESWHQAGIKLNKQQVFDDFIAAANYLTEEGYSSADLLAIAGGSNGGLLVGAVMTQQPSLFRVAFPAVGVLDMLRYHRFTAGAGWAADYGTAEDSAEMFAYLHAYSPYHALAKRLAYPATLLMTADHDDRVVPAHSFKFAARLQEAQQGPAPVLIRIDSNAGHGAGKSTAMVIQEQADKWAFMFQEMGLPYQEF